MITKCTDPERWESAPGSDASEKEVEAYLSHTRDCAFHAAIEKRHHQMIHTITAVARNRSLGGHAVLPLEESASRRRGRESLEEAGEARRSNPIGSTWHRVSLEWAFRPAMMLLVVVLTVLLATTLFFKTRQSVLVTRRPESPPQADKQEPLRTLPAPVQPALPALPAPNDRQPVLTNQKRTPSSHRETKPRPQAPDRSADGASTRPPWYRDGIYVGGGFDPAFRQALNQSFQSRGIALVDSPEQAGAILRAEQTRGEEVMVELTSSSNERLWWMNAKTPSDGSTGFEELADKIVNDLFQRIENIKRTGHQAPQ